MNILLFIFTLFLFLHVSYEEHIKDDQMCLVTRNVLCVKEFLKIIATAAKSINRTAYDIEMHIVNKIQILDTLNRYVSFEMGLIHSQIPTPQYHVQFFLSNNIDQNYLTDLFLEAHYAISFYYNTINDILGLNDIFASTTDSWFKQIQFILKIELICRYRSILNVYSKDYPLINEVYRINFSKKIYRNSPSLAYDVHSIIVSRLLREWMQRLNSVITNLDTKFL